jgi:hypothetical protein
VVVPLVGGLQGVQLVHNGTCRSSTTALIIDTFTFEVRILTAKVVAWAGCKGACLPAADSHLLTSAGSRLDR